MLSTEYFIKRVKKLTLLINLSMSIYSYSMLLKIIRLIVANIGTIFKIKLCSILRWIELVLLRYSYSLPITFKQTMLFEMKLSNKTENYLHSIEIILTGYTRNKFEVLRNHTYIIKYNYATYTPVYVCI